MARAIVKNPVGTNSGWEDVKILIAKAYQQDYMIYTLTCSYEWVNYEVTFRIMNWEFTVLAEQWDDMTWKRLELINLIEDMDSIKAILYMFETFYNLDIISDYDLLFQARDLEELVEAYLNWWIVAWEIDSLWYWKTLFYKDWDNYIIWDKQTWNDITVSVRWDDIWFSVNWAEVLNDWLEIINKDVVENVFSLATEKWACYLPITRYEELLEFLGTKLSAFENPSRFIEKERDDNRWYNALHDGDALYAYYDWVKYTAYQDWEIEQWVPNIVIEYEDWWNDIVAWLMLGKVAPVWNLLFVDTYTAFQYFVDQWYEHFTRESYNELWLIALNETYEDLMKMYSDFWLIWYREEEIDEWEFMDYWDYEISHIYNEETEEDDLIYFRTSDRYRYVVNHDDVDWDFIDDLTDAGFILPVSLYKEIVWYNYEVISADWLAVDCQVDEIDIWWEPVIIYASVLPNGTGTSGSLSYATNNEIYWTQSWEWEVSIEKDEYDDVVYYMTGVTAWEVNVIAMSADWWYTDSFDITVLPQTYNVTLSHIDWAESPMEVEEWTVISTDWDMIYIWEEACSANVEQWFVFDYFTATINWVTTTLTDWNDITVESDMTLTAVSHENVSSDVTLTLASNPSWHTTFTDMNLQTISSVTIPAWSTIYASWNQIILGSLEDQDSETIVDANVEMPYWPDHRELNWSSLEDFTDYTVQTSWTLTLVIS